MKDKLTSLVRVGEETDTALQAKEAPRLLAKKASLSQAAGVAC